MPFSPIDPNSASFFKKLTGGDEVTANVKYRSRVKFRNTAAYLYATNHVFYTKDPEDALFCRVVTIPFQYSIPRSEQNRNLPTLLYQERNAIVYRVLQAYQELKCSNYQFVGNYPVNQVVAGASSPTSSTDIHDALWNFTRYDLEPSAGVFTSTSSICESFQAKTGINWPGGINSFSAELSKIFEQLFPDTVQKDRKRSEKQADGTRAHERGFRGIKLRSTDKGCA